MEGAQQRMNTFRNLSNQIEANVVVRHAEDSPLI